LQNWWPLEKRSAPKSLFLHHRYSMETLNLEICRYKYYSAASTYLSTTP
jgi:hypothetical protein